MLVYCFLLTLPAFSWTQRFFLTLHIERIVFSFCSFFCDDINVYAMSRKYSNVNLHCDKMFHCKIRMCFGDDFGGLQTAKRNDNNIWNLELNNSCALFRLPKVFVVWSLFSFILTFLLWFFRWSKKKIDSESRGWLFASSSSLSLKNYHFLTSVCLRITFGHWIQM